MSTSSHVTIVDAGTQVRTIFPATTPVPILQVSGTSVTVVCNGRKGIITTQALTATTGAAHRFAVSNTYCTTSNIILLSPLTYDSTSVAMPILQTESVSSGFFGVRVGGGGGAVLNGSMTLGFVLL